MEVKLTQIEVSDPFAKHRQLLEHIQRQPPARQQELINQFTLAKPIVTEHDYPQGAQVSAAPHSQSALDRQTDSMPSVVQPGVTYRRRRNRVPVAKSKLWIVYGLRLASRMQQFWRKQSKKLSSRFGLSTSTRRGGSVRHVGRR